MELSLVPASLGRAGYRDPAHPSSWVTSCWKTIFWKTHFEIKDVEITQPWVQILLPPLIHGVILGKLSSFSEPVFPSVKWAQYPTQRFNERRHVLTHIRSSVTI